MIPSVVNLKPSNCVLLADRNDGLREGVRGLLEVVFDAVVMVANEVSLLESAGRLQPRLAVVDFQLSGPDGPQHLRRLKERCPDLRVIVLSVHHEASACEAAFAAGAEAFVLKREIATDLLDAVDAVMAGRTFVSSGVPRPKVDAGRPWFGGGIRGEERPT